ncbi:MAG: hypothetical protein GXY44_13655 [Phycisphaerales bacterium]|nr:hypothetical protein [Phycisphaerales bacterium]
MTTEERLDKLEHELSRMKKRNRRLWAGAACVLVLFLFWIHTHAPAVVRARQFVVEDGKGNPRVSLAVNRGRSELCLLNSKGEGRTWLTVGLKQSLILADKNGVIRASLVVDEDGPNLVLEDENREVQWSAP